MKSSLQHQGSIPESMRSFLWAVGVECSVLPHIQVNQFEWTQHDKLWREDFRMIREDFGPIGVRYCLPWSMLEIQRGKFDWGWADERVDYITGELGLKLFLDVMHFGAPLWLTQSVGDPEFPEALEEFAAKLVERYRDRVEIFCPMNEPLITALFSGDFGFWPPHSRRLRGYMPVLSRIAQATLRATRAIRRMAPEATVVLCDSCEHHHTREERLQPDIQLRNMRRFSILDLITGRVDQAHPLYKWFTSYGFSENDLAWIKSNRWTPDVIGLDYYSHTETQLECINGGIRQRKPERPLGLYGCAQQYWNRYGIPLMVTETSIEDSQTNREIWLEQTITDCKRLRGEGVPLVGYTWWPVFDNIDWDGALLHHIGKIHNVGLYNLKRQKDGELKRVRSPLAGQYIQKIKAGMQSVGELDEIIAPLEIEDDAIELLSGIEPQAKEISLEEKSAATRQSRLGFKPTSRRSERIDRGDRSSQSDHTERSEQVNRIQRLSGRNKKKDSNGNGHGHSELSERSTGGAHSNGNYGVIVFCHLRWGFVWQRPQQLLSRFAKKHPVLFIEEPMFDLTTGEARLFLHRVMPNVVVACPHFLKTDTDKKTKVLEGIERFARQAVAVLNDEGQFNSPVLYYYNPMDIPWSLGKFNERAVVYDCMDELSQFKGAPKELIDNEARLLKNADIVFTGGYQMFLKKSQLNPSCHFFGCGVDCAHFGQARAEDTPIPPDIDFMARPVLGWFGVIDERVDYLLLDKIAEVHPEWSIAMVGPVVKIDPSLLPHRPNIFWLGARDYRVLPNYCKAFDICMMPFAINDATQYINPTKALEYMATGRPIVSTAISDVIRNFGSVVSIAHSHDEFITACEEVIARPNQTIIEKALEMAEQNTWQAIVDQMQDLIEKAVVTRSEKGLAQITIDGANAPRIETDEGILEITWSYPSVGGS